MWIQKLKILHVGEKTKKKKKKKTRLWDVYLSESPKLYDKVRHSKNEVVISLTTDKCMHGIHTTQDTTYVILNLRLLFSIVNNT